MSEDPESAMSSALKRFCGEHVLCLSHPPDVRIDHHKIHEFFSPLLLKSVKTFVHGLHGTKGVTRTVEFYSAQDMDNAMEEKQWQYIGNSCIRLSRPKDVLLMRESGKWDTIHNDLRMDVFCHFDVFQRCRLRRVASSWNTALETFWDQRVNRCLYFKFKLVKILDKADTKFIFRGGDCYRDRNIKALRYVDAHSQNLCGKVTRLVLHFDASVDPEGLLPDEAFLVNEYSKSVGTTSDYQFFDTFVLKHSHFTTVMLIGLRLNDSALSGDLFQFGRGMRWPKALKVILHECDVELQHTFQAGEMNDHEETFAPEARFYNVTDGHLYTLRLRNFVIQLDETSTRQQRHIQFHRLVDQQLLLWRFPAEQLEWLRSLLDAVPLDTNLVRLARMNKRKEYSLRQAIRRCLKDDITKKIVGQWEPTGVFFENIQLTWRDCFLFGILTERMKLLGTTPPPHKFDHTLNCMGYCDEKYLLREASDDTWEVLSKRLTALSADGQGHAVVSENILATVDAENEDYHSAASDSEDSDIEWSDEEDTEEDSADDLVDNGPFEMDENYYDHDDEQVCSIM